MSKVAEFLNKVVADEAAKAEFDAVTPDEVKDFFSGNGRELSEEELAGVAGGLADIDKENCVIWKLQCPICGGQIDCYLPCNDGKLDMHSSKLGAQSGVVDHMVEHLTLQPENDKQVRMCSRNLLREHESELAEIVASHS